MKTLYIDCGMGASGDMLAAALFELLPDKTAFLEKMNALGIPGVTVTAEKSVKCGISGTHFSVKIDGAEEDDQTHGHSHGSMADIQKIVSRLPVPASVKLDIMAVYTTIAEAESHVHGVPVSHVHFHEVGAMDAIADITAVCLLMHQLAPDQVLASAVHVGSGCVRCAHGLLPVPAPATAQILRNVPIYGGSIQSELCTPTGAALLTHFADGFGNMPPIKVRSIGYGMGKKDFDRANCVRILLGDTQTQKNTVTQLCCNVDDMTGEMIGFALEQFMENGALDAFTTAVGMKKSRPGTLITLLCRDSEKEKFVQLIFKHTTTLGIRETVCSRYLLDRKTELVDSPYGQLRKKVSAGYGVRREKYEYEDLARIAREQDASVLQILESLK